MLDLNARRAAQPIQLFLFACQRMVTPCFLIEPDFEGSAHRAQSIKAAVAIERHAIVCKLGAE